MFTRRMLRISAMQHLYSFYTLQGKTPCRNVEQQVYQGFEQELSQLQHTHIQLLQALLVWADTDEAYYKDALHTYYHKLKDSDWLQKLTYDDVFQRLVEKYMVKPFANDTLELIYYRKIRNNGVLISYKERKQNDRKQEIRLINALLVEVVFANEALQGMISDGFAEWSRHQASFSSFLGAFIRRFAKQGSSAFNALHDHSIFEKDALFYKQLVTTVIKEDADVEQAIKEHADWQYERIFSLDRLLVKLGLAEAQLGTPIPVVINEYIEIAKEYSTSKSYQFVHGLLDKLIHTKLKSVNLPNCRYA